MARPASMELHVASLQYHTSCSFHNGKTAGFVHHATCGDNGLWGTHTRRIERPRCGHVPQKSNGETSRLASRKIKSVTLPELTGLARMDYRLSALSVGERGARQCVAEGFTILTQDRRDEQ